MRRSIAVAVTATVVACLAAAAPGAARDRSAPGAPGAKGSWTPADKHGFGTAATRASRVWFTLRQKTLTEAYWPTLGTPAIRDLEFVVVDRGKATFEGGALPAHVRALDARSLTYRQVVTARSRAWRLTKTIVTDPARDAVDVRVRLDSLKGHKLKLFAVLDPALSNSPDDDTGGRDRRGLVAADRHGAVALRALHGLSGRTSAYSHRPGDPRRRLQRHGSLGPVRAARRPGNVVQGAGVRLKHGTTTLSLGFARRRTGAARVAAAALARGFASAQGAYDAGWHAHLATLPPPPASVPPDLVGLYDRSLLVLAASEDKATPGAGVASPSMPWAWGRLTIDKPSAPYHLVWARDLYQVGTALIAAGDRAGAQRALDFLLRVQQKPDGSFPQNSETDGRPHWTSLQLDEVALPIVLAWQLGRDDAGTYEHLKRAADFILRKGPKTEQERWENQEGWSPGTIAAEIAGLVCAADLARRNGDPASAARWEATADRWQRKVQAWTATPNGPYSPRPYYLRLTKDKHPDRATRYAIGDGGPSRADQRRVVDPSFLELVRLGVKRWDDPVVRNSVAVVDERLGAPTVNGMFWHRFTYDGYGETRRGAGWGLTDDDTFRTVGRAWPIFAGERGEYELLAGRPAAGRLRAMANAANDGGLLPEQVWDGQPPTGRNGFHDGEGTRSATPLAWTHAQFVRLAWSLQAGTPVERPAVVARRYAGG